MIPKLFRVRSRQRGGLVGVCAFLLLLASATSNVSAPSPVVTSIALQNSELVISVNIPSGYKHAVLEAGEALVQPVRESLASGGMSGAAGIATFRIPDPHATKFLRIRLGTEDAVPSAKYSGAPFFGIEYSGGGLGPLTDSEKIGHVLSRLTYGPSPEELQTLSGLGIQAYISQQLNPSTIDESSNLELKSRENSLFSSYQPHEDSKVISSGEVWRYFKGIQSPPVTWRELQFDDVDWLQGATGIGYGDNDDVTVLDDMRQSAVNPGYLTIYLRKQFNVISPNDQDALVLRIDFDDGFVAYLNGVEVARDNIEEPSPLFNTPAEDREAGEPVEFDLSAHKALLRPGLNMLAIEVHNSSLTSSDLTAIPELIVRKTLPIPPQLRVNGIAALQQLAHVRGIYSRRQLQTVMAEFWENHFTTDYDKVADYLYALRNSDTQRAMTEEQAAAEAAQAEFLEYQFFYENALGNFGDLLLYSATSPPQLIYLDSVLNLKSAPNENYAREILELFAFGVDNRYTQEDIEQLAKCFTGWTVRKVWPDEHQAFPASSRTPPTAQGVQFQDNVLLDTGAGWKYFKGTQEPSPAPNGSASTAWTQVDFNDTAWIPGATSIGFGDNDDATILTDMRQTRSNPGYLSVYLRRDFTVANPQEIENLLLTVDYDDGFVAYLNGTEIARSRTMQGTGSPPAYNSAAKGGREAGERSEAFSLRSFLHLVNPAPARNVLAIQVHNITADSSDVSIHPRLVQRQTLPGSIENGDPNGIWTFRFNPSQHDTNSKVLFRGTSYELKVPAGRTGIDGLKDALDVVDTFVKHPSVSEFICLKLINKFVSDEISLRTYKDGTAPQELRQLADAAIAAWHSTQPEGNIQTVLSVIFTPVAQNSYFWSRDAYRAKVKTPIEFINSTVRSLKADVSGTSLPTFNDQLGMHLFTRDDPDGWSELGVDWIDTGTLLSRIKFAQALTANRVNSVRWDVNAWLMANNLSSAESIVDYFNQLLFHGKLAPSNRDLLIQFATTNDAGTALPLTPGRSDYQTRVRELVGLILSMPQWHYQ